MRRVVTAIAVLVLLPSLLSHLSQTVLAADDPAKADKPAATPADRVVVMYFHRTQRCPTCQRMGSYSEEAVVKGVCQADQGRHGRVPLH